VLLFSDEGRGGLSLSSQGYPLGHLDFRFTNPCCAMQELAGGSKIFCPNYRDFIFEIFPKLIYDARKDYESYRKEFNKKYRRNQEGELAIEGEGATFSFKASR